MKIFENHKTKLYDQVTPSSQDILNGKDFFKFPIISVSWHGGIEILVVWARHSAMRAFVSNRFC